MAERPGRVPSYRLHRGSGQAVVTLSGRDCYLGKHGTKASRLAYDRLISEWTRNGRQILPTGGAGPTVAQVALAYIRFSRTYYVKNGRPTSQFLQIRKVVDDLVRAHRHEPAADFGPLALKRLRQTWIGAGMCRRTVNDHTARVRRLFRWAVAEELVPGEVIHALGAVPGLAIGRSAAPDHPPRQPVPDAHVEAILPHLPAPLAAVVQLLHVTGMRPSEALRMRRDDLDTSADPWRYCVSQDVHKLAHRGKHRVVLLGPRAQQILRPWLDRRAGPGGYLFPPPQMWCGKQKSGNYYKPNSLWDAIQRACTRAKVPTFYPYMLRHAAATRARSSHGLDEARLLLGHADVRTTETYAKRDETAAARLAKEIG